MESARPLPQPAPFRRVLLKLSGEALMGDQAYGIDQERIESLAGRVSGGGVGGNGSGGITIGNGRHNGAS